MRQIIVHRDEDGVWIAECPSLPGCVSQGESQQNALENIKEAMEGYVEVLREDGKKIPDDRFDYLLVAI